MRMIITTVVVIAGFGTETIFCGAGQRGPLWAGGPPLALPKIVVACTVQYYCRTSTVS